MESEVWYRSVVHRARPLNNNFIANYSLLIVNSPRLRVRSIPHALLHTTAV
jgi:hypothetical protein